MPKNSTRKTTTSNRALNAPVFNTLEDMVNILPGGKYNHFNKKKTPDEFQEHIDAISNEETFNTLCSGMITRDYFDAKILPSITDIFLLSRQEQPKRNSFNSKKNLSPREIVTIILGHPIRKRGEKYFYIDVLCSSNFKERSPYFGQKFLQFIIEKLKTPEHGSYKQFALHAALPRLVSYYKKSGFKRIGNACDTRFTELPEEKEFQAIEGYDTLKFDGSDYETKKYIPTTTEKKKNETINLTTSSKKNRKFPNFPFI